MLQRYRMYNCADIAEDGGGYCLSEDVAEIEKSKWISVDDDLPETNQHVLLEFQTVTKTIVVCVAQLNRVKRHAFKDSPSDLVWYAIPGGGNVIKPTRWQYLPSDST